MINNFQTKAYLPSLKRFIYLKELTNSHYVNILKYIQNNDIVKLNEYFDFIINDLTDGSISLEKMNRIDRFCLLLHIRIVNISSELTLNLKCSETKNDYTGKIDLNEILQELVDLNVRITKKMQISDKVQLKLSIPRQLHNENSDMLEMISQCIEYINVNGTVLNRNETTTHYRLKVLENLPGSCMSKIFDFINTAQQPFDNFVVLEDNNPHIQKIPQKHKISLFDNSMFEFIQLCYTESLSNFYQLIYNLCSLNFSPEYIMKISPVEAMIYIQLRREEIEIEKEQSKKSNESSRAIPGLQTPDFNL